MTVPEDEGEALNSTEASQPSFVPPSLFRVRQFLFEQGMQIVPWASTEEVLDELHLLLQAHRADDSFWESLRELLEALNLDLQRLLPSRERQNEMLALANREALLAEVRRSVDPAPVPVNGFASLLRRVTQSCVPLLLLLAGAVAVSCGARTDDDSHLTSSAGGVAASGGTRAIGGSGAPGGQFTVGSGGHGFILSTENQATGGNTLINTNGTVACVTSSGGSSSSQLSMFDVQSIANQCIVESSTRDDVLACLNTLNTSWQQGIEWILNCQNCDEAASYLLVLTGWCSSLPTRFDRCVLELNSYMCYPPYHGVRMY